MSDVFIRKLEAFSPLADCDKRLIASVTQHSELIAADRDIIGEGDRPSDVRLIESGFCFRYKLLQEGSRQIVGFLFPGDICDLHVTLLDAMDHSIAALTDTRVVRISKVGVLSLLERPAISRGLVMAMLVNESIHRDWLANIGGRRAVQRLAHFLCEWHLRVGLVGLATESECDFPLTQAQLGEVLGLTSVHVNRSLQSLRADKLVSLRHNRLTIHHSDRLRKFAGFSPAYLHNQADRTA